MSKDTHGYRLRDGETFTNQQFMSGNYSEAVKGSNVSAAVVGCYLVGGSEDCIDFVRGGPYVIRDCELVSTGRTRTFITAKGGIDGLIVRDTQLSGRTKWWGDIRLGDHTIYNKRKLMGMKGVTISNVRRKDGKPVRVMVLDCERPVCRNGEYTVIKVPKWLVRIFMWIKG